MKFRRYKSKAKQNQANYTTQLRTSLKKKTQIRQHKQK